MQMQIRIECGLDSRSRAGVWPNDRAGVRAIRTIQGGKNEVRIRFKNIRIHSEQPLSSEMEHLTRPEEPLPTLTVVKETHNFLSWLCFHHQVELRHLLCLINYTELSLGYALSNNASIGSLQNAVLLIKKRRQKCPVHVSVQSPSLLQIFRLKIILV
jgi:hypothetical protein